MTIRQTRIWIPRTKRFETLWAETVFGAIIAPIVRKYRAGLKWFWFSRYGCPPELDSGDSDFSKVPADFGDPETREFRSVKFRYCLSVRSPYLLKHLPKSFEARVRALVAEAGCLITDFRNYDYLADLGGLRHLEPDRTKERMKERADLVAENYCSVAKLILHALKGPDKAWGRYSLPHSFWGPYDGETPFHVIHHILCNMTFLPLYNAFPVYFNNDKTYEVRLCKVRF
jgi:hypothetical protein